MEILKKLFSVQKTPDKRYFDKGVVTIITPVYNAARHLEHCLDSIIAQNYHGWKCIIIDDGSTDGSIEIARAYSNNYHNISFYQGNSTRSGPAYLRNIAIDMTTSEYIAFLDADDSMSSNSLSTRVSLLEHDTTAAAAYSPVKLICENGEELDLNGTQKEVVNFTDLGGNLFITSCILARTSVIVELNGFDPRLPHGEDWDLWLRMTRIGYYIKCATDSHINYRQHPHSLSHSAIYKDFILRKKVSEIAWSRDVRCPNSLPEFSEGLAGGIHAINNTQRAFSTYISCLFIGDDHEASKLLNEVNHNLLNLSDPRSLAESSKFTILRNAVVSRNQWNAYKEDHKMKIIEKVTSTLPQSLSRFTETYFNFLFS